MSKARKLLYILLWIFIPKKKIVIQGVHIKYLRVPVKESFGAFALSSLATKTIMIFVPLQYPRSITRYVVYHEYVEGCLTLRIGPYANAKWVEERTLEALGALWDDTPNIGERLLVHMKRNAGSKHGIALTLELFLAKKEMLSADFLQYYKTALKTRL